MQDNIEFLIYGETINPEWKKVESTLLDAIMYKVKRLYNNLADCRNNGLPPPKGRVLRLAG